MNFQNFYTLIFRNTIKPKAFLISFFSIVFLMLITSFSLHTLDIPINDNDIIRQYQLSKINETKFENISTIIIGDSSGGNAINSQYFSELTQQKTENLCLTGSWGILGSLGMLKQAIKQNNNIHNVIIIQTLDIWDRSYPKESIFEFFSISEIRDSMNVSDLISYYFNPQEVWWHIEYFTQKLMNTTKSISIDFQNDYILQGDKKYSNGLLKINKDSTLNRKKLSNAKNKELEMLQEFCHNNSLNCIFANGPIHEELNDSSVQFLDYLMTDISNKFTIRHIDKIFKYPNDKMGDSDDHIDIKYKNEVTYDYYLEINKYLE